MNPIKADFDWHDSRYLARALDDRKNRWDLRWLYWLRIALLVVTSIGWLGVSVLVWAEELVANLPRYLFPLVCVATLISMLFYTWIAEAYLFRRYISDHRKES